MASQVMFKEQSDVSQCRFQTRDSCSASFPRQAKTCQFFGGIPFNFATFFTTTLRSGARCQRAWPRVLFNMEALSTNIWRSKTGKIGFRYELQLKRSPFLCRLVAVKFCTDDYTHIHFAYSFQEARSDPTERANLDFAWLHWNDTNSHLMVRAGGPRFYHAHAQKDGKS